MSEQTTTAERPTGDPSAADPRRRAQAVTGVVAGGVVVLALVAVLVGVRLSGSGTPGAPAAAPAPTAAPSAVEPSAAAPTPAPAAVRTPAALTRRPVVRGGTGTLTALKVSYLVRGTGPRVRAGQTVTANYVLVSYRTGKVLDTSWDRGQPFTYRAGAGNVIQGWDRGLLGVPVGSRVRLDVPAALAYGPQQGDLRFVVDVLAAA